MIACASLSFDLQHPAARWTRSKAVAGGLGKPDSGKGGPDHGRGWRFSAARIGSGAGDRCVSTLARGEQAACNCGAGSPTARAHCYFFGNSGGAEGAACGAGLPRFSILQAPSKITPRSIDKEGVSRLPLIRPG